MSLYLVPASRENLEISIEKAVAPEQFAPHVSNETLDEIRRRAGMEGIRCWAMTESRRSAFNAMQPGDIVLLSESGTRHFTHYAQVTSKLENRAFGDALWPVKGESPWEFIYFLRNIRRIRIPKAEFVTKLGYKSNFEVPGTTRVRDEQVQAFESKNGPIADWFDIPYISAEYADALGEVRDGEQADYSATDVLVTAKRRRLHENFAKRVKANYGRTCAMCDISEEDFLVAGHIVAWSEDEQNRLNPANGLCLCLMHDRAFERGYLMLDEGLHIRLNPQLSPTSPMGQRLKALDGQRIRTPEHHPPDQNLLKRHRDRFLPQK
jgi:HNH endonuclease